MNCFVNLTTIVSVDKQESPFYRIYFVSFRNKTPQEQSGLGWNRKNKAWSLALFRSNKKQSLFLFPLISIIHQTWMLLKSRGSYFYLLRLFQFYSLFTFVFCWRTYFEIDINVLKVSSSDELQFIKVNCRVRTRVNFRVKQ